MLVSGAYKTDGLTSRSAPARYAQEGSCPSHAPQFTEKSWDFTDKEADLSRSLASADKSKIKAV